MNLHCHCKHLGLVVGHVDVTLYSLAAELTVLIQNRSSAFTMAECYPSKEKSSTQNFHKRGDSVKIHLNFP